MGLDDGNKRRKSPLRLLIVLGDSATISHHKFYKEFLGYAAAHGDYRSAYEWMEES